MPGTARRDIRGNLAHERETAYKRAVAAVRSGPRPPPVHRSPVLGLDGIDELVEPAIDTLSEPVARRDVVKQRQSVSVPTVREFVNLEFGGASATQVQLHHLVVTVERRIKLAICGIEQHAQIAVHKAIASQAQDIARDLETLQIRRVQEFRWIGVRRSVAADCRVERRITLEQRLPFALRYLHLREAELERMTVLPRIELPLPTGVDQRLVSTMLVPRAFGKVIPDPSERGKADAFQIPLVEGIREVIAVPRPVVDSHPDQVVVLHEGADVRRHAHDRRCMRFQSARNDQLEPVQAVDPLPGFQLNRQRDEPVPPVVAPFRVTVGHTTMALDLNGIQPPIVAKLRPSPGVFLLIALQIRLRPVEMCIDLFEMRHVIARQMQFDQRQLHRGRRTCRSVRNVPELSDVHQHHGRHGHDAERRHETMLVRTTVPSRRCASTCHPSSPAGSGNRLYRADTEPGDVPAAVGIRRRLG